MDRSPHNPVVTSHSVVESEKETKHNEKQANNDDSRRYLTLVVKGDKVFMVPRDVLFGSSPFFEKLLKSDAKGNEEGTTRLEMLTAPVMEIILKIVYNGRTQIKTEEEAENVIVVCDHLLLQRLKDIAVRFLQQRLSICNCVSISFFAEERQWEELTENWRNFIQSNFVKVA